MTNNADTVLIRFGEIGLKNQNRGMFVETLRENLRNRLTDLETGPVRSFRGGLEVRLEDDSPVDQILQRIRTIAGIVWFAPAVETSREVDSFTSTALDQLAGPRANDETFAVRVQRSDKEFFLTSVELERRLGGELEFETGLSVDLDDPDWKVRFHVMQDRCLVFDRRLEGPGGLPTGTAGDVICLLSGGIDSPVASILAQKRGARTDFLHVYAYPSAERALSTHVRELVESITPYGTSGRLFMVPYTPFDIGTSSIPQKYQIVLFRRHIIRLANRLADFYDHQALITGDSLGQVASQTMENLTAISRASNLPILRPLIGMDKNEIIKQARNYGTYSISTRRHQDCCSLNDPHPETRASISTVEQIEAEANLPSVEQEALEQTKVYRYSPPKGSISKQPESDSLKITASPPTS